MARTIAVTGAAGNLGRLVVDRLLDTPEVGRVLALDRQPMPRSHEKLESVLCDVRDPDLAKRMSGAHAVVHLAFIVERGSRDEKLVDEVNLGGTRNVCAAAAKAKVKQVVYASSVASYGFRPENDGVELEEESPLHGDEGFYYPRTKAQTDRIVEEFGIAHPKIAVARLRPSLFLGPRTDPKRVAGFRAPFFVYPSGASVPVQLTHEDDVADAFVLAIEKEARGAFNVAAREPLPLSRWGAAMGKPALPLPHSLLAAYGLAYRKGLGSIDPAWVLEPARAELVVSSEKIRSELGWMPRYDSAGAVLRVLAGRPTATASAGTKWLFGSAVLATRYLGGIPLGKRERAELRGVNGILNLMFTGDRPSEWHVKLRDGNIGFFEGMDPAADATTTLKESVFLDMLSGKLPYMRAQMTGRVRFRGDGHLVMFLGAFVEGFRQAHRAKGLRGLPPRSFTRFVLRQSGVRAEHASAEGATT